MFTKSARFYDAIYAFKDYESEAAQLNERIRTHSPSPTVLDVACGTGLHLAYLKDQYTVEGLDLDPNMLEIALGRTFDAVLCLFSSIGYTKTVARLRQAVETMARHLCPGGLLVVEPWLTPEAFEAGRFSAVFVDEPDLKIARMNTAVAEGTLTIIDFHYLVGTRDGFSYFTERHEVGLFTHDEYLDAFRAAGLAVDFDPDGFMGHGLYLATADSATADGR